MSMSAAAHDDSRHALLLFGVYAGVFSSVQGAVFIGKMQYAEKNAFFSSSTVRSKDAQLSSPKLTRQKIRPRTAAPFSIPTWHFNGRLKELVGAWENQQSCASKLSKLQPVHSSQEIHSQLSGSQPEWPTTFGKCHEEPGRTFACR